ncbi:hypothetical protein Q604_UNBc4C00327G0001 [human gut metagenome]|uniref:Uncharacterized protein n=1 Tax=human gut metagenome TaxID=408170 RepID=W1WF59_9ZZZZ
MTASMLMVQKPRIPWTMDIAWCPGGLTKAKARSTSPRITASAAAIAPPADTRCASVTQDSKSGAPTWTRSIVSQSATIGLYSTILGISNKPSSTIWSRVYSNRSCRSGWVSEIFQSKAGKNTSPKLWFDVFLSVFNLLRTFLWVLIRPWRSR